MREVVFRVVAERSGHLEARAESLPLRIAAPTLEELQAGVPASGVNPPAPPPRRRRGGPHTSVGWSHGWPCKGWAGPFPWFEN
ncbi:MAG: hypothetical protein ACK6AD_01760, partial [Cyanobacteriota bacterium]